MPRHTGVLYRWNSEKGFGFLRPFGQARDVLLHISELRKAAVEGDIRDGQRFHFEILKNGKGGRAVPPIERASTI